VPTDSVAATPTDSPVGRVNGVHPGGTDWDAIRRTSLSVAPVAFLPPPAPARADSRPTTRQPTDSAPTVDNPTDNQSTDKPHTNGRLRAIATLGLVNGLAIYGQLAYVYDHVAPDTWRQPARVALSVGAAAAFESIALFVKAHGTARRLRRASYLIAAVVALANYAHFAHDGLRPTAAAVMFGLVSLLSPWLWGLHTRRTQHLQLVKERRADEAGAEFSADRRRHFPIRTWQARRWSIDHGVTDPAEAWRGYNADRQARRADRTDRPTTDRPTDNPVGDTPTDRATDSPTTLSVSRALTDRQVRRQKRRQVRVLRRRVVADNPVALSVGEPVARPVDEPTPEPVAPTAPNTVADSLAPIRPAAPRPTRSTTDKHSAAAVTNAAILRQTYPKKLTDTDGQIRKNTGWSYDRLVAAKAAYLDRADLKADKEMTR
jgi:hypothetical protein